MFQSVGPTPPGVFGLDGCWASPPNLTISFPLLSIDDLRARGRIFFVKWCQSLKGPWVETGLSWSQWAVCIGTLSVQHSTTRRMATG